mmetsp:Transcript_118056/g.314129  ORF Transcript_118056/g.314129 Transcript_118056/m.314129 type:complete len:200 (+) Transcript_118056:1330-1929(+)
MGVSSKSFAAPTADSMAAFMLAHVEDGICFEEPPALGNHRAETEGAAASFASPSPEGSVRIARTGASIRSFLSPHEDRALGFASAFLPRACGCDCSMRSSFSSNSPLITSTSCRVASSCCSSCLRCLSSHSCIQCGEEPADQGPRLPPAPPPAGSMAGGRSEERPPSGMRPAASSRASGGVRSTAQQPLGPRGVGIAWP